ncbi:hypothetical protein BXZ70DRAFT_934603 [Cristinia sonorae]|uniref:DUF7330 domain-containing protein n=1 Tax=Cristinia sonorae TaxID=1940300 RepID=A0A8K0XQW1_9AGAR|nr:hypothetical protein BXZ70DRAFT_934603 [Cristinia sonorae]
MLDSKKPLQESPPPYAQLHREPGSSTTLGSSSRLTPQRATSSGNSVLNPATPQYVNRFTLHTKHNHLSGYFVVDPSLEREEKLVRARAPQNSKNRKYFDKKQRIVPNAVFSSRRGDITLNLVISEAAAPGQRSYIQTQSSSGTIYATLSDLPPKNNICFEATTKKGNIIVLIPPNFYGGLHFRSSHAQKENAVTFLPEFAKSARLVHGSDKDTFVLFGSSDLVAMDPKTKSVDLCLLTTGSGHITVGITGLDYYEEPKVPVGFWKRLFGGGKA